MKIKLLYRYHLKYKYDFQLLFYYPLVRKKYITYKKLIGIHKVFIFLKLK